MKNFKKNNLKIAVQLYGHLRTFRVCAPKLKEFILDCYDCDVFIHSWDSLEHHSKTWHDHLDEQTSEELVTEKIILEVANLYQPKSLKIESQDIIHQLDIDGFYASSNISLKGIKSMLYSLNKVNLLRLAYQSLHNIHYDYVIIIRPDIMINEQLDLESFKELLSFNVNASIHLLFRVYYQLQDRIFFNIAGAMDVFFFAHAHVIDKICNCYEYFDQYFVRYTNILPNNLTHPEISFYQYILAQGIIAQFVQFNFIIKRKNAIYDIKLSPYMFRDEVIIDGYKLFLLKKIKPILEVLMSLFRKIIPQAIRKYLHMLLALLIKLLLFLEKRCL